MVLAHDGRGAHQRRCGPGARGSRREPGHHRRRGLRLASPPPQQRTASAGSSCADGMAQAEGYISAPRGRDLVGQDGVAVTDLRPAGTAQIGAERVDVVTEGEYVQSGHAGAGGAERRLPARGARDCRRTTHSTEGTTRGRFDDQSRGWCWRWCSSPSSSSSSSSSSSRSGSGSRRSSPASGSRSSRCSACGSGGSTRGPSCSR